MSMPALAVVGADHQIIRSTESFRRKCDDATALCKRAPELDLVLTGKADTALVDVGDLSVSIEAVTDDAGRRQAILSLPADDLATDPEGTLGALREAAADSPAIVWVKDLEGRYLYINASFAEYLETSEERLLGSTDADLPPVETVDGPRLRYIEDGLEEPLQLEYTVPAYESRPAMAAFRFPLRNGEGQPIATCGVAAASTDFQVASDEAVRLMQLERWNRIDPLDVRAELLEQWHMRATLAPGPRPEPKRASLSSAAPPREAEVSLDEPTPSAPVEGEVETVEPAVVAEVVAEPSADPAPVAEPAVEREAPVEGPGAPAEQAASFNREDEWVRQLRQAARIGTGDALSETADALQSDLKLARTWAERADQLQGDLQESRARLMEVEAEARQASTAARLAGEEAKQYRAELDQARGELERGKAQADAARAELEAARHEAEVARTELEAAQREVEAAQREAEVARRELSAARAQSESLRAPSDAALRLSEELGRALTAERERGDELARVLARVRSRLGDFEGALDRTKSTGGDRRDAGR